MAHGYQMKLPANRLTVNDVVVFHDGDKFVIGGEGDSYELTEADWIDLMKAMKAVWATWRSQHPDDKIDMEEQNRRPHPPRRDVK